MGLYDDCPCRFCVPPKRHPACHGNCKDYAEWHGTVRSTTIAIRKQQQQDSNVVGFIVDSQRRVDKRLKIKK